MARQSTLPKLFGILCYSDNTFLRNSQGGNVVYRSYAEARAAAERLARRRGNSYGIVRVYRVVEPQDVGQKHMAKPTRIERSVGTVPSAA